VPGKEYHRALAAQRSPAEGCIFGVGLHHTPECVGRPRFTEEADILGLCPWLGLLRRNSRLLAAVVDQASQESKVRPTWSDLSSVHVQRWVATPAHAECEPSCWVVQVRSGCALGCRGGCGVKRMGGSVYSSRWICRLILVMIIRGQRHAPATRV
jgi:hypothetical protein